MDVETTGIAVLSNCVDNQSVSVSVVDLFGRWERLLMTVAFLGDRLPQLPVAGEAADILGGSV